MTGTMKRDVKAYSILTSTHLVRRISHLCIHLLPKVVPAHSLSAIIVLSVFQFADYDGMSLSQMVVDLLNLQAGLPDAVFHVLGVIHFRVAVGHGSEIEACHGQAE